MDRGLLAEHRLEVGLGERPRVEGAEPPPELERARERLLHGDLLVEREPDEQRERIGPEQRARLGIVREPERRRHGAILQREGGRQAGPHGTLLPARQILMLAV